MQKISRSAIVPLFVPLRMVSGHVQGIVRLKQIAALGGLGSIGKSTLLISPRYGNRLAFSGVVTEMEAGLLKTASPSDSCGNCDRCVRLCPGGAIGPDGVDTFRCRNISPLIPVPLIPSAKWVISHEPIQHLAAPFAPIVARYVTTQCSLCVAVCPWFKSGENKNDVKGRDILE